MMSLGDIAAKLPFPVFACDGEKRPVVRGGFKSASRDRAIILDQFSTPGAAMIGCPTGEASGLIAIDVDIKNGAQGRAWLDDNAEALPQTLTHKTRSGGLHLIFRAPAVSIRNSAGRVAPGVDVRGEGGYIIVPPSPGYTVADPTEPADMPQWLIRACLPPDEPRQPYTPNLAHAERYAEAALIGECRAVSSAPDGMRNQTLNNAALKLGQLVAGGHLARGVVEHELTAAARSAGLDGREIVATLASGLEAGLRQPRHPPEREAAPRVAYQAATAPPVLALTIDDEEWDEASIRPRPWIAPGYLMRGAVTVVSGPGSAGKSSLMVAWCIALALGQRFNRFDPSDRHTVLTYNVEDDRDEQRRRFSAALRQFGATPREIATHVVRIAPKGVGTLFTTDKITGLITQTPAMDALEAEIERRRPAVLMLDPMVELHDAEENDNTAIRAVLARFRALATTYDMAVVLCHHARKGSAGAPGDPDTLRGASAIVGAARIVLTLGTMTKEEADAMGVSQTSRPHFFRVDGAKSNYAPLHEAEWFERHGYELDNGETVAAAISWAPPSAALSAETLDAIITAIAVGTRHGPYLSAISTKYSRSISHFLRSIGIDGDGAMKEAVRQIMASGRVFEGRFQREGYSTKEPATGLRTASYEPFNVKWVE